MGLLEFCSVPHSTASLSARGARRTVSVLSSHNRHWSTLMPATMRRSSTIPKALSASAVLIAGLALPIVGAPAGEEGKSDPRKQLAFDVVERNAQTMAD